MECYISAVTRTNPEDRPSIKLCLCFYCSFTLSGCETKHQLKVRDHVCFTPAVWQTKQVWEGRLRGTRPLTTLTQQYGAPKWTTLNK